MERVFKARTVERGAEPWASNATETERKAETWHDGGVSGLIDPSRWHGPTAKTDLEDRFAELISPFESIDRFDLTVTVDGVKIDPARVARKVRNEADATFSLAFDGRQIRLAGKVKMCELEPSAHRKRVFNALCGADNGEGLLAHLLEAAKGGAFRVQGTGGGTWFLRFEQSVEFSGLDKLILLAGGEPAGSGAVPRSRLIPSTMAGNGNRRSSVMRRSSRSSSNHWRPFGSTGMGLGSGYRVIS